ncbi:MAG: hypothetical protein NTU43_04740 [Bacteroidetes bacterium]|nr:hypothetical protein [Bacteroidota bacterium]
MKIKNCLLTVFYVLIAFVFSTCKKDNLNFDKYNGYTLNPEFGIPIVNATLDIKNLIKNDTTNIHVDGDGLIRFVYRKDSLISYKLNDLFKLDNQSNTTSINKSIGEISIDDVSNSKKVTLGELSQGFSPAVKANFSLIDNSDAIFPAVNENITTLTSFSAISEFSSIKFSKGWLVLSITNWMPVPITLIQLNLYNLSPSQTLLGTFNFANIPIAGTKSDSIQINNKQISSSMGYTMPTYSSASSAPSTVKISSTKDSIVINLKAKQLKAISGSAIFPNQDIATQNSYIELNTGDSTQQIRKIKLTNGSLKFIAQSTVNTTIQLMLSFPFATKNGVPLADKIITIPTTGKFSSYIDSIDIGNVSFDLTKNPSKKYNNLPIAYTIKLLSSNTINTFDSSNYVDLKVSTTGATVDYAEGFFGNLNISSDTATTIDNDFLSFVKEGLNLDDPKLTLDIYSSLGVPITFNYDFTAYNNSGKSQDLQVQPFELSYPLVSDIGGPNELKRTTRVLDKTNSKVDKFVSLPPHKIKYSGKVITNLNHNVNETQYISSNSALSVNMSMDMPIAIHSSNFSLVDSFDFNAVDIFDKLKSATIVVKMENGFPFNAMVNMMLLDSNNKFVDSLPINNLLISAITDANGKTIQRSISRFDLLFDEARIKKITTAKVKKIKMYSTIITENQGSKTVRVYSDYDIKISLGVIGKVGL